MRMRRNAGTYSTPMNCKPCVTVNDVSGGMFDPHSCSSKNFCEQMIAAFADRFDDVEAAAEIAALANVSLCVAD